MSRGRFWGRSALVTGGGTGIGRAISVALAAEGAHVTIMGRRPEPIASVVAEIGSAGGSATACQGDVTNESDVPRAVALAREKTASLDVLVASAGIVEAGSFLETDRESWDRVLSINLDGVFLVCQAAARAQVADKRPLSIVTIGSMNAFGIDGPFASYHTSKHALVGLTRAIAVELGPQGVRANAVNPGYTKTEFDEWPPNVLDHLLHDFRRVPLRRMIQPEEVATAVLFLASDEASGITGASLAVDGGLTADLHGYDTLPFDLPGPSERLIH